MMAQSESFEVSPNKIEAKGKIRGITRISKKAKLLASIVLGALLFLVIVASYKGFNANKHQESQTAAAEEKQDSQASNKGITSANFDEHMKGVGDGQAALAALDADSASGVPVIGPVSPSMPGNPVPGTAVAITGSGASGGGTLPTTKSTPGLDLRTPSKGGAAKQADLGPMGDGGGMRGPGRTQEEMSSEKLHSAIDSGINVEFDTSSRSQPGTGNPQNPDIAALKNGMAALSQAASSGAGRLVSTSEDPNKQIRKEQFLKEAQAQPDQSYLKQMMQPAMSQYEIAIGWAIPASLGCGANTDLPGQLCAIVRENVCDSATGKYLLIPQGTKVVGSYDSQVAIGQQRILVVWNQLQFDDGSSLDLKGMPGSDQAGYAGFDAQVDNHYMRAVAMTGLMSVFSAAVQLSQPQNNQGNIGAPTPSQTIAASVGQQVGQLGVQLTQRQLQVQPTLSRSPGYRFNIMVTKRIMFPGEYKTRWGSCS
jgi:type IV secretory pathway VirB10-like protein